MIVKALKEDAFDISKIEQSSLSYAWSKKEIEAEILKKTSIYLIYREDEIMASISARIIFEEADINNIVVKKERRNQGIGKELIFSLEREVKKKGIKKINLEVSTKNIQAIKLYSSCGFKIVGERKKYYSKEEGCYIMSKDTEFLTLGIETSCDETSICVLKDGREVLSNVILSQIPTHKIFGGVVPEIASREHFDKIDLVFKQALLEADKTIDDIDLIAVTKGPGLVGALLVGLSFAKALALAKNKEIVGVNHMRGHICAGYIEDENLKPPFLSLVVSGGHTMIVDVIDDNDYEIIGQTRDDAVGEAFDKVARVLEIGYPGGPIIDKMTKEFQGESVYFKRVFLEKGSYDFSFSGIKTGVINYLNKEKQLGREINKYAVAKGFSESVIDVLVSKVISVAIEKKREVLSIAGGVASNSLLRDRLKEECSKQGIRLNIPSPIYCTDNAAMIAVSGYREYMNRGADDLDLDASPNLSVCSY